MPSAIVERQMLPRQTKSTDIGSGIVAMVGLFYVSRGATSFNMHLG